MLYDNINQEQHRHPSFASLHFFDVGSWYYSPRHEFLLKAVIRQSFAITVAKTVFIKDNPNYHQQC